MQMVVLKRSFERQERLEDGFAEGLWSTCKCPELEPLKKILPLSG